MMLNLIKVKFLGGEAREFGGEASPLSPPLDETLPVRLSNILTIAGNGEGCNVSSMMTDEDPDQCNIEDHALHQHPHEGD